MRIDTPDGGMYQDADDQVPSVSALLDILFTPNNFYTADGADRGTRVHQAITLALQHNLDWDSLKTEDEDLTGYVKAAMHFLRMRSPSLDTQSEVETWHPAGFYAGTIDLKIDGAETVLVDWKTGARPARNGHGVRRDEMQMQAYLEMIPGPACGYLVYLTEDGKYKEYRVERGDVKNILMCAREVWNWRKK